MFGPPSTWEYPTALAAAVVVGATVFLLRLRGAQIALRNAIAFVAAVTIAAVLGGRIHMLLESGSDWSWSALLDAGYRQPGALVALFISIPLMRRWLLPTISLGQLADAVAPSAAFAIAIMRLGCLAAGCCFGIVSDLPWAVRFPMGSLAANLHSTMGWLTPSATSSLPVHPLQVYFALLALGTGLFLLWLERRKAFAGELALVFVVMHEGGKFFLEFLRSPGLTQRPAAVQMFSLAFALSAAFALAAVALPRRTGDV